MRSTAASSCPAISWKLTNRAVISAPANVICSVDFTARGQPGPKRSPDPPGHLLADLFPKWLDRRIVGHQRRAARGGQLGFIGDDYSHIPQCCADPGLRRVVDVGMQRQVTQKAQVHRRHQRAFRRKVGVGAGRRHPGASRNRAHRQVGVRRFAQLLQPGIENFANRLPRPTVRPASCARAGGSAGNDRGSCIFGHQSSVGTGYSPNNFTPKRRFTARLRVCPALS